MVICKFTIRTVKVVLFATLINRLNVVMLKRYLIVNNRFNPDVWSRLYNLGKKQRLFNIMIGSYRVFSDNILYENEGFSVQVAGVRFQPSHWPEKRPI